MKILLVITHGNIGGATNVVYELAKGLRKTGQDVIVGFGEGAYLSERLSSHDIPIHRFRHLRRTRNPFSLILFINEIRRLVTKERFDIVQCNSSNTLPGLLGAKLARKKTRTAFTIHGLSMLSENHGASSFSRWIYGIFFRFFLSFADIPVFVSQCDLDEALRLRLVHHGHVIHNGIDPLSLHFLSSFEARHELGNMIGCHLDGRFIIGSIGRLSHEKNYEFIINAFPDILAMKKDAVFLVIGEGTERADYEHALQIKGLEKKIFFPGQKTNASRYLRAFDVFVLPSRFEGLPVTIVECLMAGTPVIASDVGGNREILRESSLYPLNDEKKFLRAFLKMIEDPKAFLPTQEKENEFTSEVMTRNYLTLFL